MNSADEHNAIDSDSLSASKYQQDVAGALLQSIDPLMEELIPIIRATLIDYIIAMRRQLLSGDEFLTVRHAARRTGISIPTLYVWIDKGILTPIHLEGKIYVSISELRLAKQSIYQPAKARKQTRGKRKMPSESKPQPEIQVRNGLPYFPHLRGESKGGPKEI